MKRIRSAWAAVSHLFPGLNRGWETRYDHPHSHLRTQAPDMKAVRAREADRLRGYGGNLGGGL
ncbi:hypothetical protein [Kitasatospora sp. NBC_01266]|uniref:hypothetical protein n=1 Tax=Kitasatospora sp. NBC_01266 TaxID=2903572 RepID=UPI002E2F940E|nr:hypothetical protein [Kitasatospora sp. NBC_01266]